MTAIKKYISVLLTIVMVFGLAQACIPVTSASSNTAEARNYATITDSARYRNTLNLVVGNVTSATSRSNPSSAESAYTVLINGTNGLWARSDNTPSTALLEVDPSNPEKNDIRAYNIFIALDRFAVCSAQAGKVRWGIQLYPDHSQVARAAVSDDYNTVTVTSNMGHSRTYTLCDENGNTLASAETGNGSFLRDSTTSTTDVQHGPYYWYLKGPTLLPGEEVKLDVAGICITNPYNNNNQMLVEWCALTIRGVCEHSKGFDTKLAAPVFRIGNSATEGMGIYNYSCSACGAAGGSTFEAYDSQAHRFATVSNYSNYRNTVEFELFGVKSGTSASHPSDAESAFTEYAQDGSIHLKSSMAPISATLEVDPSGSKTNVSEYNMSIKLNPVHIYSHYYGRYRYGVILQPNHNTQVPRGGISDEHGSVTVVSNKGISRTYTLVDINGQSKPPAVGNNTFYVDLTAFGSNDQITLGDIWYLSGPILQPDEVVNFDIIASNYTILSESNSQFLSEWCNFTIRGVCNHSNGFTEEIQSAEHFAVAQSCTSGATYYKSCATCGANGTETFVVGSPLEHSWNSGEVITPANCCVEGTRKLTCTVCSETTNVSIPIDSSNHTGNIEIRNAASATCGSAGYTGDTYCADCNVKIADGTEISSTGVHSWNSGEVITPANCCVVGTRKLTCTVCSETTNVSIPIDSSNHTGNIEIRNAASATCGSNGYTGDTYCADCNVKIADGTAISSTGVHSWNSGEVITPANCCVEGTRKLTCTVCSETTNVAIPIDSSNHTGNTEIRNAVSATCGSAGYTGDTYCADCNVKIADGTAISSTGVHSWNSGEVITPANCCVEGTRKLTCTVCNETTNVSIPIDSSNHTGNTEIRNAASATCGSNGYTGDTYCADCNVKIADGTTISSTGVHSWNSGEVITPANCCSVGTRKLTCTVCSETTNVSIPIDSSNHTGNTEIRNAASATCGSTGYTGDTYCADCNVKISDGTTISSTGIHSWNSGEVITPANCCSVGTRKLTCTVCNETTNVSIPIDSSNHTGNTEIRNAASATCGSTGYTGDTYCADCNVKIADGTTISSTGIHSWNSGEVITPANCCSVGTRKLTCTVCSETTNVSIPIDSSNHTGNIEIRNAASATCGSAGYTGDTYCADCNVKIADGTTISSTGAHSWNSGEVITPANCCSEGTRKLTCTVCSETTNVSIPIDSSNHTGNIEIRNAASATCGSNGYTGDTYCADCNVKIADGTTISSTGVHSWNSGEVITPANCCSEGSKKLTCTVCSETTNVSIPIDSSNHTGNIEIRNAASATCGSNGYTGDTYCADCNVKISDGTEISSTGIHSWNSGEVITPANCCDTGVIKYTCTACAATLDDTLPINSDNHKNIVADAAVAATCTATGLTAGSHCAACGETIVEQTELPVRSHEFGEWTIVREATQENEGLRSRQCRHCSAVDQQTIERLPSNNEPDDNSGGKCKGFSWLSDFFRTIIEILKVVFRSIKDTHS